MMKKQPDDVTLVDEFDHPIGAMDKIEAHRGNAKRHRAISVFLFNKKNELLIQQRSAKKIVGGLQWANTCCGNVWPGESYEECARRRLRVELGITEVKIRPLFKFEYHVQCNEEFSEWEMDTVFIGKYDGEVVLHIHEAKDYQWIDMRELKTLVDSDENGKYVPWLHIVLNDKRLMTYSPQEKSNERDVL